MTTTVLEPTQRLTRGGRPIPDINAIESKARRDLQAEVRAHSTDAVEQVRYLTHEVINLLEGRVAALREQRTDAAVSMRVYEHEEAASLIGGWRAPTRFHRVIRSLLGRNIAGLPDDEIEALAAARGVKHVPFPGNVLERVTPQYLRLNARLEAARKMRLELVEVLTGPSGPYCRDRDGFCAATGVPKTVVSWARNPSYAKSSAATH